MTLAYDKHGFRTIRHGQPSAATGINCGNGKEIQHPGTGKDVEKMLREMKEARG